MVRVLHLRVQRFTSSKTVLVQGITESTYRLYQYPKPYPVLHTLKKVPCRHQRVHIADD